jgi:hypothetical protein
MERILKYLYALKDPSNNYYRILQDKIWVINIYITRVFDSFSYSKGKPLPISIEAMSNNRRVWLLSWPCDSKQSF